MEFTDIEVIFRHFEEETEELIKLTRIERFVRVRDVATYIYGYDMTTEEICYIIDSLLLGFMPYGRAQL